MDRKKILFVMRQSPYGSNLAREALEAVLAAGSFEQQVSVLFMDDGVLQLLGDRQTGQTGRKNHCAMLQALPLYEVDQLYADSHSLRLRKVATDRTVPGVTTLDTGAVQKLMAGHHHILSF